MSARFLAIIVAGSAVAYCVAAAPAAFIRAVAVPPGMGLSIERATGTIWKGTLEAARAEDVLLGDIAFRTDPLALLSGRLAADLSIGDGALAGNGKASLGLDGRLVVENAKLLFELDAATRYAFLGAPLQGMVRVTADRLIVSREGCIDGRAKFSTNVLAAPAKRFAAESFDLSGEGACSGKDFLIALSGKGGEGAVTLSIRVGPDLAYTLIAEAQPARAEVAEALQYLGFQRTNGALTIGATGVIHSVRS